MIPTHLSELILMTGGGSYSLDASCHSNFPNSPQQQFTQLPFEQVIVNEVELNLPVHLYTENNAQSTETVAQLMVMMPSIFLGSNTSNIGNLKIIFKVCQEN